LAFYYLMQMKLFIQIVRKLNEIKFTVWCDVLEHTSYWSPQINW